ncbi:MAG: type II secretion system protein GspN, partial [Xanthomonadales bacterium]|nr:type II secretion system protein GspN [Xanthomonadales bacterium]
ACSLISSPRGLLIIAALTLVIGLVALFPARIAYQWAATEGVSVSGIQGSVWRGRADALNAGGVYLRDVRWAARPWHLLTGRMLYRVEAAPVAGFLEG